MSGGLMQAVRPVGPPLQGPAVCPVLTGVWRPLSRQDTPQAPASKLAGRQQATQRPAG
eukprot:NODE_4088_length_843_cov_20.988665_g3383_i0.p5 GENE.NODE_4088_length_843_cov_20.988665_g3383_i0~~NODE_4088_length_843_cov_20.988665_g3383_i0.p5  ORF type:complete len:58 (+),score=3.78 NODE_4088_length_843_cov_20.988665_g3383_i0:161-334(+)